MSETFHSDQLPAVLVGGPPHSGKSVLIYSLSQALRTRGIEHYALRACPDGEGDWSNEAPPQRVRQIRIKGRWTPQWVERISFDIERRHLPLLVDVGGRPTAEQAQLFGRCTHAVLLTPNDASRTWWWDLVAQHQLPVLADLRSQLHGEDRLEALEPVVRGVVAGLERNSQAGGPAFLALAERVAQLFTIDGAALHRSHLADAPAEIAVDLDRLARTLGVPLQGEQALWQPGHIPLLLDYLPAATPLAVYGRNPAWVCAALARLTHPARFHSFDPRLGWVEARPLRQGDDALGSPLRCSVDQSEAALRVTGILHEHYIDYGEIGQVVVPPAPDGSGVILSGKLPLWLYASLALSYSAAPWLAVNQPPLGGSVVVHSVDTHFPLGKLLPG